MSPEEMLRKQIEKAIAFCNKMILVGVTLILLGVVAWAVKHLRFVP